MITDFFDPIGITKSRIAGLLASSEEVREALQYKGLDAQDPYDPNDPSTLIWNCIIPVLKDPDTITTSDPQILIGVESDNDMDDPRRLWLYVTIVIIVDNTDMRTDIRYVREDLLKDGICAYTKPDYVSAMIKQAIAKDKSITWVDDVVFLGETEGATNNTTHYGRTIKFRISEINPNNRGI